MYQGSTPLGELVGSCQELQAKVLADANALISWHRGLHTLVSDDASYASNAKSDDDGSAQCALDMKKTIQRVKERLSQTACGPIGERLAESLDDMLASVDSTQGEHGTAEPENATCLLAGRRKEAGNAASGEAGMRTAARCLESLPKDMARLRELVEEASRGLAHALEERERDGAQDMGVFEGLIGHAAIIDTVADGLDVLDVVVTKLCRVGEGLSPEEVEALEGVVLCVSLT